MARDGTRNDGFHHAHGWTRRLFTAGEDSVLRLPTSVSQIKKRGWRLVVVAGIAMALAAALPATRSAAAGNPCGPPVASVIACENTQTGDPESDWLVNGSGDSTLQGFATSMSVNLGNTVTFKIKGTSSAYHIDILRMGYYQG